MSSLIMGKNVRIIPRLDIKGPNLVKGIHLEGLRVLGKPEQFARYYYEAGADELIYMDVVASLYGRNSLTDVIRQTSKHIFIPLTVGGGLRTIDDIQLALQSGADRVSLNTAAINNPQIIEAAAKKFGSSTIVIEIQAIKQPDGKYLAFTDNGREFTGKDVFEWASQVVELGAGEILITSVDREGTGQGFDTALVKKVSELVPVPVVANGGAGDKEHVRDVILDGRADSVSIGSLLHYDFIENIRKSKNSFRPANEGNVDFLKSMKRYDKINACSISELKLFLTKEQINCRHY